MFDFAQWFAGLFADAIIGVTGGNAVIIILTLLLGLAYILIANDISMPFAMLISFMALGIIGLSISNPNDPIIGTGSNGIGTTLFYLLLVGAGLLTWHLFFKKSGAGS